MSGELRHVLRVETLTRTDYGIRVDMAFNDAVKPVLTASFYVSAADCPRLGDEYAVTIASLDGTQ